MKRFMEKTYVVTRVCDIRGDNSTVVWQRTGQVLEGIPARLRVVGID